MTPELFERDRFFRIESGDTYYDSLNPFGEFYNWLAPRYDNCTVYGDKIPGLYRHYDKLNQRFNRPAILFILRNVFDVAASYNRRARAQDNWRPDCDYRVAVADWNESFKQTQDHFETSNILVVENETLFYDEVPLAPLFAHLGLELCPAVNQRYAELRHQASELEAARRDEVPAAQKRYILKHADFHGYRSLLDLSRSRKRLLLPRGETLPPTSGNTPTD